MVGIYCRVSTAKQLKGKDNEEKTSIILQRTEGIEFAKEAKQKHKIYSEAYSAGKEKEGQGTEWKAFLSDIESKKMTIAFFRKLDRLPRSPFAFPTLYETCKNADCKLYIADMGGYIDFTDENKQYILSILSSGNVREKRVINRRTKDGLIAMYDNGYRPAAKIYGWSSTKYNPETGRRVWEVNQIEKSLVMHIFDLAIKRKLGLSEIARKLNEEGYITRKGVPFTHSIISQILKNKTYAGKTHTSKNEIIDSKIYTPFISYDDFKKLNGDYNKRFTQKKRGRRPCHMATGILQCAECKSYFYYFYGLNKKLLDKKGNPRKMEAYTHGARANCGGKKRLGYKEINKIMFNVYFTAMLDDSTELIKKLELSITSEEESLKDDIERLTDIVTKNNKSIKNLSKIIENADDIDDDDETLIDIKAKRKHNKELQKQIEDIQKRIDFKNASLKSILTEFTLRNVTTFLQSDGKTKRDLLKRIIEQALVDKKGTINITLIDSREFTYDYKTVLKDKRGLTTDLAGQIEKLRKRLNRAKEPIPEAEIQLLLLEEVETLENRGIQVNFTDEDVRRINESTEGE